MSDVYLVQNPRCSSFSCKQKIGFVSQRGTESFFYEDLLSEIAHAIWTRTDRPKLERDLILELVGRGYVEATVMDITLKLSSEHILLRGEESKLQALFQRPSADELPCDHLLVCLTGAVQTASFHPFLQALRSGFCRKLKIILTQSARELVQQRSLLHQLDAEVFSDTFEQDPLDCSVRHIALSEWASCILVAPATAAAIHRIAHATCDDLLSLTLTATSPHIPVVIGPSMNTNMWQNTAVQDNLSRCKERGYWVIHPGIGFEVSTAWERRTPSTGVFGAQPGSLVRIMTAVYQMHNLRDKSIQM